MQVYRIGQKDLQGSGSNSHHNPIPCMEVTVEEDHIQFMLHITFRVKTVSQLEKEKKKVVEVTHKNYDIYADYDSEGSL